MRTLIGSMRTLILLMACVCALYGIKGCEGGNGSKGGGGTGGEEMAAPKGSHAPLCTKNEVYHVIEGELHLCISLVQERTIPH